jgi:exopolysaccharide production protein ExoZ
MQYSSGKILNIQALRGVAVLLVIALHLAANEAKYGHGYRILPEWLAIGASGVDVFFVISGFVMATITRGEFRKPGAIPGFLYHRVTRIYPAYWFYSLIMLGIFLVQRETGAAPRTVDIPASFLLLPQAQLPLLVVGWTLVHEMYFYLGFALLLMFPERWLSRLLVLWGAASVAGRYVFAPAESPLIQLATNPLILEFIAGALIARWSFSGKPASGWLFLAIALLWWMAGYGVAVNLGLAPESSEWRRVLVFGVPAALGIHGLVALEKHSGWILPDWLVSLGNASYSVYLSHLLVIATLGKIWERLGLTGFWVNGVVLGGMLVSVVVFGMASFRLMERPLLSFSRRYEKAFIGPFRQPVQTMLRR